MPGVQVIRPADGNETRAAWKVAMETTDAPTILVLSRQNLPVLPSTKEVADEMVKKARMFFLHHKEKHQKVF